MQVLTLEKNRGYLIAGIGAIVTLFAFMFLPFISVASVSGGQATLLNVTDIAQNEISIWMECLAAVTAITIAALIALRPVPFSMLKTTAPIEIQTQWGNYLLILAGIFGVITPLIAAFTLGSISYYSTGISVGLASGSWLSLLGMVAVVVGGVLALRTLHTVPQHVAGMYTQYPPVAQPQPWVAPADPYASVAPPQQWDSGQQVPPTQMQQWNGGQTGQPPLPSQQQWNPAQPVPPMQQPQWNTGQPTLPAQQPQWNTGQQMPPMQQNTGQPTLPAQQPQWNPGQPVPPAQPQWNPGQQVPPGPPYQ